MQDFAFGKSTEGLAAIELFWPGSLATADRAKKPSPSNKLVSANPPNPAPSSHKNSRRVPQHRVDMSASLCSLLICANPAYVR
jgi:hypothetical protein